MSKIDRAKLRNLFGGKCAYCGKPLGKVFHADHVAPIFRGWEGRTRPPRAGEDANENLFPACPRCNIRKATLDVEGFRNEIEMQIQRLRRDSSAFCLAEDFGTIAVTGRPIKFWFEQYFKASDAGETGKEEGE